ncbi:MAG TPA: DUF1847 domain-containing protein [Spirochaetota bacterium]|nr:DUF1847 domain-containing protein [Spirochaetota bacterium]HPI89280.1 DUF1847 domain-containing protein [Spirochaetota bacterium]HPR48560.1 DUF1847 domain-containing protein [Spirochaetota bacterium]
MSENSKNSSRCVQCAGKTCYPVMGVDDTPPSLEEAPDFCPMRQHPDVIAAAESAYTETRTREFARLASIQEAECYEMTPDGIKTRIPRIEEIIQFARKCGFTRIGIAFCIGLREEARLVASIFEAKGLDVVSVCCKVGRVPKESIGIQPDQKISPPALFEPMCNPIAQAEIINAEQVDLAVQLGLCVGHDTLFMQHCRVPSTVLAVKDRVTGHNPLAAVYLSKAPYYGRLKKPASS